MSFPIKASSAARPQGQGGPATFGGLPGAVLPAAVRDVLAVCGCDAGQPDATVFTIIQSTQVATKTYGTDPVTGAPMKTGGGALSEGQVLRASLSSTTFLNDLAEVLSELPSDSVLACGALSDPRDKAPLTTKDRLASTPGAIARTKGFAVYPSGQRGLVLLDHDAKDLLDDIRARLDEAGGLVAVLASVCPEFARAGLLARPSVSTGIRTTATGATTAGGGVHLYFVAEDGADIPAFIKRLHLRLILAGWGWVFTNKVGSRQVRSLIDISASGDPERLVFEADAILGLGLEHTPGARACKVERDGVFFNTRALAELSLDEEAKCRKLEADLLAAAAQDAKRVQDKAKQGRTNKLVASGPPPAKAQARVAGALGNQRLDTEEVVHLDDGRTPTVAEILRNPAAYNKATGADPLEPDYGGGRNKAIWYTDGHYALGRPPVRCLSFAHGGQEFEAGWSADDLIETWNGRHDPAELLRMYPLALLDDPDKATLAAAGVPSWPVIDFGLNELNDLKGMIEREEWTELSILKTQFGGAFEDKLASAITFGDVDSDAVAVGLAKGAAAIAPEKLLGTCRVPPPGEIAPDWELRLARGSKNQLISNLTNAVTCLSSGCGLGHHLRWDRATGLLVVVGVPSGSEVWNALTLERLRPLYIDPRGCPVFQWSDTLLTTTLIYLESRGASLTNKRHAEDAVATIAEAGAYSSVADYLRGLQWDGVPRLDGWLVRHASAEANSFNHNVLGRWMPGAVARALHPEERTGPAQMDNILTLLGPQGAMKSSFFRGLCAVPLWHTENSLGDLSSKDAVMRIASAWIVDIAEGGSLKANEVETFKQFVTTQADTFRPPFGRYVMRHTRRNVFAMTVNANGAGFLRDGTGNRRFWIVEVDDIDIAQLGQDRDQLWAEAVARFDAGQRWWFDKQDPQDAALEAEAAEAAESQRVQTSIEVLLRKYIHEEPKLDQNGRARWSPRPVPLSVVGNLEDVLAEIGRDGSLSHDFGVAAARRAMTALGWKTERIAARNGPVERFRTVWVDQVGVAALASDKRSGGRTHRFPPWLEQAARAGALGLHLGQGANKAWFEAEGVALSGAVLSKAPGPEDPGAPAF